MLIAHNWPWSYLIISSFGLTDSMANRMGRQRWQQPNVHLHSGWSALSYRWAETWEVQQKQGFLLSQVQASRARLWASCVNFREQAGLGKWSISCRSERHLYLQEQRPEGQNSSGKRVIADGGYPGQQEIISGPNPMDPKPLRKFKSRARMRHESFNSRLKRFRCLDVRFRHGVSRHKVVFEAICVICQYQLENGHPLFDV